MFTITGTIKSIGDVVTGTTQNGNTWARQTVVLTVNPGERFEKDVAFEASTRNINEVAQYKVGDVVEIGFDIHSRIYKDRWYTSADVIYIDYTNAWGQKGETARRNPHPAPIEQPKTAPAIQPQELDNQKDDLPF